MISQQTDKAERRAPDRKYAVLLLATPRSWRRAVDRFAVTLDLSRTYEKEFGKGKSKITVPAPYASSGPFKAWQMKADSIRKLNRAKKEQMPDRAPVDSQPEEVPF